MSDCSKCVHLNIECTGSKEELKNRKRLQKSSLDCFESEEMVQRTKSLNKKVNDLFSEIDKIINS